MVAAGGGGAPSFGGNPVTAIVGLVILVIVVFVVWKISV